MNQKIGVFIAFLCFLSLGNAKVTEIAFSRLQPERELMYDYFNGIKD